MPILKFGDKMPDFTVNTAFQQNLKLKNMAGQNKTAILFLRYYGCTLCQYDMHLYTQHFKEIIGENGKIIIVLQSAVETIQKEITQETYPFPIICDPNMVMYKELNILPAGNTEELVKGNTMLKVKEAEKLFSHKEYEGEELQLPAAFIIDKDMTVVYAKYGKNAGDILTPEELKTLLK